MQLSTPITFGVVGLGRIGLIHAQEVVGTKGFELMAACDASDEALTKLSAQFQNKNIKLFKSFDGFLNSGEFQVLIIATPSNLHYSMAMKAIEKKFHVLVEKPMAATAEEGRQMAVLSKKMKRFLTVNQSVRYQKDTQWVKEVVDSGILGKIFSVYRGQHGFSERKDWQKWKKYGGGAVANVGSHFMDAALQMTDAKPATVFAKFNQVLSDGDAEDGYKIIVRCEDGTLVESEFLQSYYGGTLWHICGTKGSLCISDELPLMKMRVKTIDGKEMHREYDFREDSGNHRPYYQDLSKKLCNGELPAVTPESVIKLLTVIDAARESDKTGLAANVKA